MFNHSASNRSLVLAGGGVRLAYHAGVLMALEEAGLQFGHIDGTSGGIFGAAMMASGITPREAAARWRRLKLAGFLSPLPLKDYGSRYSLRAMGDADGIRRSIFPTLGIDAKKINANNAFDVSFNVCNFSTKTVEVIPGNEVTEDHLVAGMSLPLFMPALKINGQWYTDAVWIKDANLTETVRRGAEEIWLVWCIGNNREYLNGFFNQYVHMIEISANGGVFLEVDGIRQTNEQRKREDLPPVTLHVIRPAYPLPLDPDFFLQRINADTLINMGYEDARQYLEHPVPFDFNAPSSSLTTMKDPGITLHFRQQFRGAALLGDHRHHLLLQLSFFFRQYEYGICLQQYASVAADGQEPVSGYHNKITADAATGMLTGTFIFIFNDRPCRITYQMEVAGNRSLFGLQVRTIRVTTKYNSHTSGEHLFRQPLVNRLRNAWHTSVKAEAGFFKRLGLRRRILHDLFKPYSNAPTVPAV